MTTNFRGRFNQCRPCGSVRRSSRLPCEGWCPRICGLCVAEPSLHAANPLIYMCRVSVTSGTPRAVSLLMKINVISWIECIGWNADRTGSKAHLRRVRIGKAIERSAYGRPAGKREARSPICYRCGKDIFNAAALTCEGKDGTMRWCIASSVPAPRARRVVPNQTHEAVAA